MSFGAHAVDQAGNEASTGRRTDGSAATLRLPARIDTRLAVGVPRVIVRRKVEQRHGHRRLVRRRIRRLDSSVVARHGRVVRLTGFLANADGQPIDGATIEALEKRPAGGAELRRRCDHRNRRQVPLRREGHSKPRHSVPVWRFEANRIGNHRLHDSLVPANTSIRPDRQRLLNGQQVLLHGTSDSPAPCPRKGKLVEMQAYFRGRWRTFSTVRASPNGRWHFPYRFGGTVGRVTYRFRARLPAEGGYPVHQRQLARRRGRWYLGPDRPCEPAITHRLQGFCESRPRYRAVLSSFRKRLSYSNVTATAALFIALGGTSYAVIRRRQRRCREQQPPQRRTCETTACAVRDIRDRTAKGARPKTERPRGRGRQGERAGPGPPAADAERVGGATAADLRVRCPADTVARRASA